MADNPLDALPDDMPDDDKLLSVANLVKRKISLEAKIADTEDHLSRLRGELYSLEFSLLPEAMTAAGTRKFELSDGTASVEVEAIVVASLPSKKEPDRRAAAIKWLQDNELGSIISVSIGADFSKGNSERAAEALQYLQRINSASTWQDESVHAATLNKAARELNSAGKPLPPEDLFKTYVGQRAKVKLLSII